MALHHALQKIFGVEFFICVFGFILIELGLPTILARMITMLESLNGDFDYVKQQGPIDDRDHCDRDHNGQYIF